MSKQHDEYQRRADEAQRWADRATDEINKAAWLRVVEGWLSLIKPPARTPEQKFNEAVRDQRKGGGETDTEN